ncbi:MAG TPA: YkgJ family cysteine cluster protein, partial [Candidatus Thermoplasmatota archaeon]|nr:YkgJ family cysteine cluster protein [Candidatus Thermoplasmatota archaeon]
ARPMETPTEAEVLAAARAIDLPECGPCGGKCCRTPWTVFATPRDLARLEAATGRPAASFARVAPVPAWERDAYGEGNLLFSRVAAANGEVPQLAKREDGACVFLDGQGWCGVHEAKPLLCRLFPFYYERAPYSPAERPSPLRTERGGLRLLIDRGHTGFCPIPPERLEALEGAHADRLLLLMQAFEADIARYEGEKEAFVAAWLTRR